MSTYTDIRYNYNLLSGYGGSLNLISTQTASASASISFTSGIDSSYRTYLFKFINIHPSNDNVWFQFNLSTDGGSNYNVTKTTTSFNASHNEAGTDAFLSYDTGNDLAQSTSYQRINVTGNQNDECISGVLYLFSPSSNTYVKHFLADTNCVNAGEYDQHMFKAGYGNTSSPINSVDFKFSAGNIDAGTIKMYGIA